MNGEDDYLLMSGIQHFSFCRRQWALIHIEQQWAENLWTAEGRLDHKKCHDDSFSEKRKDLLTVRGMRVVSHRLKLVGNCDVVEFHADENGVSLQKQNGLWTPLPIEYKHGHPKENDADRLQLCAQVMALEEMLVCNISEAALYYAEIHRREKVEITEDLRDKTISMAKEMLAYYERGYTPKTKPAKHCSACSLKEVCLPVLCKNIDPRDYIQKHVKEVEQCESF